MLHRDDIESTGAWLTETQRKTIGWCLAGLLLIALIDGLEHVYYDFLRLGVTAGGSFLAVSFWRDGKTLSSIGSAALALAFNPFVPLEMDRSQWQIIDLVAAPFFIFAGSAKPVDIRMRLANIQKRTIVLWGAVLVCLIAALAGAMLYSEMRKEQRRLEEQRIAAAAYREGCLKMDTRELLQAPHAEQQDLTNQLMSGQLHNPDNGITQNDSSYLDPSSLGNDDPIDQFFEDQRDRADEYQAALAGLSLPAYRVKRQNEEIIACRRVKAAALNKSRHP